MSRNISKTRAGRLTTIANQMMCGGFRKRTSVDPKHAQVFRWRYGDIIEWVDAHVSPRLSAGVCGAIGKAAILYGRDAIAPFCASLSGDFNGEYDPAHVLYRWLMGRARYNARAAYRRTVAAIRAFLNNKQFVRNRDGVEQKADITPAESDFFEWDDTFTRMLPIKRKKKESPSPGEKITGEEVTDAQVEEEVAQAIAVMNHRKRDKK